VAEKESITNIHKQLTCVYGVNALTKALLALYARSADCFI